MQMLKGLGPSVVVSKIDFLFLSRIEKRWKNVKRWIFHWAICKDCLVHGRCINRMHYNLQWWQNQSPSYCHNYPQIKSLLCLIATLGGRGRGETGWWTNWLLVDLGFEGMRRIWDGGSWQWQTDHFNWKPCSEHCCILSGKLANVRNRCTFPILSPPPLLILHIFKVSLSFKCKAWR